MWRVWFEGLIPDIIRQVDVSDSLPFPIIVKAKVTVMGKNYVSRLLNFQFE